MKDIRCGHTQYWRNNMAKRLIVSTMDISRGLTGIDGELLRAQNVLSMLGDSIIPIESADTEINPELQTLKKFGFIDVIQQDGKDFYQATYQ